MARQRTDCGNRINGFVKPMRCGGTKHPCDACIDHYVRTKAEQIMRNDLHDDPYLVRHVAGLIVETLGRRAP